MNKCMSCGQQRDRLVPVNSALLPFMELIMCRKCMRYGYEPRFVVVLKARADGIKSVKSYLEEKKYYGEDISATELV